MKKMNLTKTILICLAFQAFSANAATLLPGTCSSQNLRAAIHQRAVVFKDKILQSLARQGFEIESHSFSISLPLINFSDNYDVGFKMDVVTKNHTLLKVRLTSMAGNNAETKEGLGFSATDTVQNAKLDREGNIVTPAKSFCWIANEALHGGFYNPTSGALVKSFLSHTRMIPREDSTLDFNQNYQGGD